MLDFLLTNIPLLICIVAGLGLVVVEIFLPGFGVPGIAGLVLLTISVVILWVKVGVLAAMGMLLILVALLAIALSISLRSASNGVLSRSALVLREASNQDEGITNEDMRVLVGRVGETRSVLRPAGIADFEGVRLNVVSNGDFIPQGTRVRIESVEGTRIVVRAD